MKLLHCADIHLGYETHGRLDPETGLKLTAGRAELLGTDYRNLYLARRETLAAWAKRLGWSYTVNHTDRVASEALVKVHMAMTSEVEIGVGGGR